MALVLKIVTTEQWTSATEAGRFDGAPVDLGDGYIHLSTPDQVRETAKKHFAGQTDLQLVAFEADTLGPELLWEPSRGGALFPHLYRSLSPTEALWVRPLPLDADGEHVFPETV